MQAANTNTDDISQGPAYDSSLESTLEPVEKFSQISESDPRLRRPPLRVYNRKTLLISVVALAVIVLVGLGSLFLSKPANTTKDRTANIPAANYAPGSLSLQGLEAKGDLQLGQADHLAINGQLRVNNTLVLAPTTAPSTPTAGQIYYDQKTNAPYYYDGNQFVSLAPAVVPQHVTSIGGTSGSISVGNGLQVTGSQLALSTSVTRALSSLSAGQGVSSLQGQTGAVTLTGGSGIAVNGTTITNKGVISLAAGSANVVISQDGNGNYTLIDNSVVGAGTTGQIALFTGGSTLGGSILSQSGTSLSTTGSLIVAGAISSDTVQHTAPGQNINILAATDNVVFTAAGRTFTFPNVGAASQTICTTAGNCGGGGAPVLLQPGSAQLDVGAGSSLFVNNSGGGNLLQLQGAGSDRFVVTNSGNVMASGTVTFSGLSSSGVVHTNSSGLLSTGAVILGTDTSGSYVSSLGGLSGLTTSGNSGAESTPTLSVVYGSSANTAVQGNTTLTCATGTGNLTGGGNVLNLGIGGSCNNISISSSPLFSGNLSVQGANGITVGVPGAAAGKLILANGTNANLGTLQSATLGQTTSYTLPDPGQASATICLSSGNCLGGGAGGASTSLSNLASVAINTSLLSGLATIDLGSGSNPFRDLYLGGSASNNFHFTGTATVPRTITIPDANGSICLTSGNCAGVGGTGDIVGNGTSGTVPLYNGTKSIANSIITQSGTTVTVEGTLDTSTALSTGGTTRINNSGVLQNVSNADASNFFTGGALTVARGGTGVSTTPNNGQFLIGNGAGYSLANLTSGDGTIVVTNGIGTINLSAPGSGTCASCVSLQATTPGASQTGNINITGAVIAGSYSGNGAALSTLNGSNISSGTVNDARLSGNVALLNGVQTFSGTSTFSNLLTASGGLTVGTSAVSGLLALSDGSSNTTTLQSASIGSNLTFTLPASAGGANQCIKSDGTGILSFGNCLSGAGGGGGVTDLNGFSGSVTVQGTANQVIASNAANVVTLSLPQSIAVTSSPTFAGLTLSSALTVANGGTGAGTFTSNGIIFGNGTSALGVTAAGNTGQCLLGNTGAAPTFGTCSGAGGVSSLNGLTGALTIANSTQAGSTITLNDATTAVKGIASFNTSHFTTSSGAVSLANTAVTTGTYGDATDVAQFTVDQQGRITNATNVAITGLNSCSSCAPASGGNYIAKNANDSSSASFLGTLLGLTNTNAGAAGVLSLTNAGTNAALGITQSGNPAAGQALILANNTNASPSGNLIDLQANGTSEFSVSSGGAITSGLINGQTISNAANFSGTLAVAGTINGATISGGSLSGGNFSGGTVSGGSLTAAAVNGLNVGSTAIDTTGVSALSIGAANATLTVGSTAKPLTLQGNASSVITATGGGFTTTVGFNGAPIASQNYYFDRTAAAGSYTICTTANNCVGSGGGVTTSGGTTNRLSKFTGTQAIGNSNVSDNGTVVDILSGATVQGAAGLTVGTSAVSGLLALSDGSSNTTTLQSASIGSNLTFTLPASAGGANQCIKSDGTGILSFGNCLSGAGGGGGVTDLNGFSGSVTVQGTANQVIASNAANVVTLSLPQSIAVTSSPTFAGLTLSSALTVANGGTGAGTFTSNGIIFGNGTSALGVTAAGNTGQCLLGNTGAAPTFGTCSGAGGVSSLNGLTGALTIANSTQAGSTITLNDATTAVKGIASFNTSHFTTSSGAVSLANTAVTTGTYGDATDVAQFTVDQQGRITNATNVAITGLNSCSSCAPASGGNYIAKNANDSSSASFLGTLLGLTNTNAGAAGVLSLTNAGTNAALGITQSGNPAAGQALILANNTNASPSGNLIDLQANGTSEFSVSSGGAITSGLINGQTISNAANFSGTLAVAGTINGATISGGSLSGGNFSGGTVSGGSLTAAAVNGLNVGSTAIDTTGVSALSIGAANATLTVGSTAKPLTLQGNASSVITATGGGFTTTVGFNGAPIASQNYYFDRTAAAGSYTICTTANNCVGSGGGVTTSGGTTNRLSKFTGTQAIGNSNVSDNGTVVDILSGATVQGAAGLTVGTSAVSGLLALSDGSSNTTTLQSASIGSNLTFTLPASAGGANQCIKSDGTGILSFGNCLSGAGGGGGVTDLNGFSGSVTVQGTANQVIASNAANVVTLSLPQSIAVTSSPTFAGLTLSSALTVANGGTGAGTFTSNGIIFGNGTSALGVTAAGNTGQCLLGNTGAAPTFGTCSGAGGVSSLNGLTGALTIANSTQAGSTITLNDATTAVKGIASFNTSHFTTSSGAVSLANTAVTTGTYGDATDVAQFTVDQQGRITNATNVAITGLNSCSSCAPASGGNYIAKNANDSSSASFLGTLLGLTNTNAGAAGVLSLTNAGTNAALGITQSGNPAAGQALILANNTNASPSGNLIDLQANGTSEFSVTASGAVTATSFAGSGASLTSLNGSNISSGTVANARLNPAVTLQGNTFNGASQLVQLNASSQLPAVSGALLTNLNGANITAGSVANAALTNSSLTISNGTNLTGGGVVALGGSLTVGVINNPTFSGLITGQASTTGLNLTGAPVAGTGITSLLQLGSPIAGGNTAANGGTYFGINTPASGNPGFAADFLNFQVNGTSKLKIGNGGEVTVTGTQPASGNANDILTVQGGKGSNGVTGGIGSNVSIMAGDGGNGSTTNGAGGNITLQAGNKGTGAGSGFTYGNVLLNPNALGVVGIGVTNANINPVFRLNIGVVSPNDGVRIKNFNVANNPVLDLTLNTVGTPYGQIQAADDVTFRALALNPSGGFVGVGTSVPNTALDLQGALSIRGMAAPAASVAGQGRIYFDSTSNTFKVSENSGAYTNLLAAGATTTLQNAYDNSSSPATILTSSVAKNLVIQSGSTFDTQTLLNVKTAAGGSVLDVDTLFQRVGVNISSPAYALDVRNSGAGGSIVGDINVGFTNDSANGVYRRGGVAGLGATPLSCAAGFGLGQITVSGGIVTAGSCSALGGASATLQQVYNSSTTSNTAPAVVTTGCTNCGITFQSGAGFNSSTMFQVQDASSNPVLDVDTANKRVGIGTNAPATQLHVAGMLPSSGTAADNTGNVPKGVYVQGNYAYVANSGSSLVQIYDVSTSTPHFITSFASGTGTRAVVVQGIYAYTVSSTDSTFRVFDISNPVTPVYLSTSLTTTGNTPWDLYVKGRYAYVVDQGDATMKVYDVANPAYPVLAGTTNTAGTPVSIYVQGRYAYVATGTGNSVQIFDVSNPASIPAPVTLSTGAATNPTKIYVQDRYAYVVRNTDSILQIIDVSNPGSPVSVGTVSTGANTNPSSIYVQGRTAYVVLQTTAKLAAFDVSNPAAPVQVGTGVSTTGGGTPEQVFVSGRNAIVTSTISNTVQSFDLGGAYIQQLDAGGLVVSTLQVRENLNVNNNADIKGSLVLGQSLQVNGNSGFSGQALYKNVSDSTTAFRIQNAAGTNTILSVDTTTNTLTVANTVVNGTLTINGHIITAGLAPTVLSGSAACVSPGAVTTSGNDSAGTVSVTTGSSGCSSGILFNVQFAAGYSSGVTPRVVLTPANAASAAIQYFAAPFAPVANGFIISTGNPTSVSTSYIYNYHVEQ